MVVDVQLGVSGHSMLNMAYTHACRYPVYMCMSLHDSLFMFHLGLLYTGSVGRRLLHITVVGSSVWYMGSVALLGLPSVVVR